MPAIHTFCGGRLLKYGCVVPTLGGNDRKPSMRRGSGFILLLVGVFSFAGMLYGADEPNGDVIVTLKSQIAAQQKQLESMQKALAEQQRLLDSVIHAQQSPPVQQANSAVSVLPVNPRTCDEGSEENAVPPFLPLWAAFVFSRSALWTSPVCGATRTQARGSAPVSAVFPYNNTATSKLSEFRFSPQNSRIGFRIDGNWRNDFTLHWLQGVWTS